MSDEPSDDIESFKLRAAIEHGKQQYEAGRASLQRELEEARAEISRLHGVTAVACNLRADAEAERDAALVKLRDAAEAVQWFLTGEGVGLKFGGDMATPGGLLDGLIAARRTKGE